MSTVNKFKKIKAANKKTQASFMRSVRLLKRKSSGRNLDRSGRITPSKSKNSVLPPFGTDRQKATGNKSRIKNRLEKKSSLSNVVAGSDEVINVPNNNRIDRKPSKEELVSSDISARNKLVALPTRKMSKIRLHPTQNMASTIQTPTVTPHASTPNLNEDEDPKNNADEPSLGDECKHQGLLTPSKELEQRGEIVKRWIDSTLAGGISQLKKQFKTTKSESSPDSCVAYYKNTDKNRYPNIPCVDRTRFTLLDDDNFYIHANRVRIGNKYKFICTQAPTDSTTNDFWKMVAACEPEKIVMLCSFVENGTTKCAKYFPDPGASIELDTVRITNESLIDLTSDIGGGKDRLCESTLRVIIKANSKELKIAHIQWTTWQDHGMPESLETSTRLLAHLRKTTRPTIVHCSAGVGRTGTLIFIEAILVSLRCPKRANAKDVFASLRRDRAKMVQTFPQFVFAHRCILEYLFSRGYEKSDEQQWETFKTQYTKLMSIKNRPRKDFPYQKKRISVSMDDDGEDKNEQDEKINENGGQNEMGGGAPPRKDSADRTAQEPSYETAKEASENSRS